MFQADLTQGLEDRKSFLALLVEIYDSDNAELMQEAADQFPINSLYNGPFFSKGDAIAFSKILSKVRRHIEKLLLFNCKLYTEHFGHIASAIKSMDESIDEFCLCHNDLASSDIELICEILPKINQKLCIVKCFAGNTDSRNANEQEKSKLQEAMDKIGNKELIIQLDDCGCELKSN
uniref:NACHT LRR and PYD domain-containing protein n=1 Tax=Ciona savignyi TaxID=51511 RepID=H2YBC7_CIOSA